MEDAKMSYVYDKYVFHYITESGITYMCMTDDDNKRRIPFAFLEDIQQKFRNTYGDKAQTAIAFAMNTEFGRILQQRMDYFNNPASDTFSNVTNKLDDVKNIMVQNIENVLERGERLELLVDKTENLHQQAFKFQKSSRQLRSAMYWRKIRFYLIIALVVCVGIWIITAIACGIDYSKCKKNKN